MLLFIHRNTENFQKTSKIKPVWFDGSQFTLHRPLTAILGALYLDGKAVQSSIQHIYSLIITLGTKFKILNSLKTL